MKYNTKKRQILLDLLESRHDETLTAEEIVALLGEKGISRSAVYRNLSTLETEGVVKRVALPGDGRFGYRYLDCDECREHLHLECSKCGKTYHLDIPASSNLINSVLKESHFAVDSHSSVLYGVCEKCRKA